MYYFFYFKKYIRIYPALKLGNERFFYFCNGCKKLGGLTLITAATAEFFYQTVQLSLLKFIKNCNLKSTITH